MYFLFKLNSRTFRIHIKLPNCPKARRTPVIIIVIIILIIITITITTMIIIIYNVTVYSKSKHI